MTTLRLGIKVAVLLTTALVAIATADVLPLRLSAVGSFSPANGLPFADDLKFVGLSGAAMNTGAAGSLSSIDLGTITFPNPTGDFSGMFVLTVAFGSQESIFSVPFTVRADFQGHRDRLFIDFETSARPKFRGTDGKGDLTLQIRDVDFSREGEGQGLKPRAVPLTAIYLGIAAAVPEPGSIVLLGTVFCGVMLALRRKKID